jgi:hypothetical protein
MKSWDKKINQLLLVTTILYFNISVFAQVATLPVFYSGSFGNPSWTKTDPNLAPIGFTWNSATNANNLDGVGGVGASLNNNSRFIQIHFNQSPNELSFMYRRQSGFGGTARIFESVDGINWGTAIWTMGAGGNMTNGLSVTLTLNPNSRYVRFDRTGSDGRLEIDAISITPAYRANVTMIDHGSSNWCVGETRPVTVRFQNTGSMTWFASGNTSGNCADPNKQVAVSYRWNGDPNWDVYNNRNPLPHDVPPGGTVDVTFPVQSPNGNPLGPNNLSVNLIVQECLWFNNANPVFTSGSINISDAPTVDAGSAAPICAGSSVQLNGSVIAPSVLTSSTLYSENFSGTHGWIFSDANRWSVENSSNAGGSAPELRFQYFSGSNGTMIDANARSPLINATNFSNLSLSFRHRVVHWTGTIGPLTLETSTNGTTWTQRWSSSPTGNIAATLVSGINLSALDGQSFYIRFRHNGNIWNIDFWYIDDVTITGDIPVSSPVTYSWSPTTGLSNPNILDPIASPTTTTTYTLTATSGGCSATDDVVVTVTNPTMASSNGFEICHGGTTTMSVSGFSNWTSLPTGGTISTFGNNERIHVFNANGTFNTAQEITNARLLVIGGGGGGGSNGGGGGGAGMFLPLSNQTITSGATTVTIGAGGAVHNNLASPNTAATNGGNSSFGSITAGGGGGGASRDFGLGGQNGHATFGGSGGGGGGASATPRNNAGIGTLGGNNGANGTTPDLGCNAAGGGGGGAGGPGVAAASLNGGNGGPGLQSDITGTSLWYAGGGGGGITCNGTNIGTGGSGGGGNGTSWNATGSAGTPNSGSGGGAGFTGGSGVVIVRYAYPKWTSSNTAVATINEVTGVVTTVGPGITEISFYAPNGCVVQETLTVDAPPTAPTSISGTTAICNGQSTTLTAMGGGNGSGAVFQWGTGAVGTNIIGGQTTSTLTASPTTTTTYWVRRIGNTSCNNTTGGAQVTVQVDVPYTAPTLSGGGTVCFGQERTLNATGGTAPAASISWHENVVTNPSFGTGSQATVSPAVTTDYVVAVPANGACPGDQSNIQTITVPTPSNALSSGATATCLVHQNGWVHFLDASGNLIASINSNGQNLGNVDAQVFAPGTPITGESCDSPGDALFFTEVMGRHWVITPQHQPTSNVSVRLPFNETTELDPLITSSQANQNPLDDVTGIGDLGLSKYSGPANVDGNLSNNCASAGGDENTTFHGQTGNGSVSSFIAGHPANDRFVDFSISSFSEFWLHGSSAGSPLPVEFDQFSTVCTDDFVVLNWTTKSEVNASHWVIERSRDGWNWEIIGDLNANGNTNATSHYEWKDPITGSNFDGYYRLQQVDFDGTATNYGPFHAQCNSKENQIVLNVYPNPAQDMVNLNFSIPQGQSHAFDVQLLNATGQTIAVRNVQIQQNNFTQTWETQQLNNGMYSFKICASNGECYLQKFVIHR